ncbi:MAG: CHAT domain-containing tetratricopeptide repeat protein, partial [Hyphomicrobium sp.]
PDVGASLNNLAELYRQQGRYEEAEPLYKRDLAIIEQALGREHLRVGTSLNNLAMLYHAQGRTGEAEPLFKRSLAIIEQALGREHPRVGASLKNLGGLYQAQGRTAEAEPLYQRSLVIREKALGREHPDVGATLNSLATLYESQGRTAEAEPLFKRSLAIFEQTLGREHPRVAHSLNNLALLYRAQGRTAEAEPLFKRSLVIKEKALGRDHPDVGIRLSNLAALAFDQRDWRRAADFWRRSTNVLTQHAQRGTHAVGQALTGKRKSETERDSYRFLALVKAGHRLASQARAADTGLSAEMFQMAQWAHSSEAAAALSQMAARQAKGSGPLATLVRERQDLVGQWQKGDEARTAAASRSPDQRNAKAEAANSKRLAEIEARIATIDATLGRDFPDYAAIARPQPLSIAEVQAQLHDGEALVLFLDTTEWKPTPEETFIWVVTKTESSWVRSDLGTTALQEHVAALRCGLDGSNWHRASAWPEVTDDQKRRKEEQIARRERCHALTGTDLSGQQQLPFDLARAHDLYHGLFGEIEDVIKGKHLLIVPSGPLTSLPFQVLVAQSPDAKGVARYRDVAWLARKHAITVLPSVASLATLRRVDKGSSAPEPFIGYGDPVLSGHANCGKIIVPDTCPDDDVVVTGLPTETSGVLVPLSNLASLFRNGVADVAAVRKLCPLPDTAHELKCVARSLGAKEGNVIVGHGATEAEIKKAPLDHYRVVHFATHGLLAGETVQLAKARAEPALVLTPPDTPSAEDDGLLTASEITTLKLDADWVVMSACNTAGSDKPGAEPLSGLASAFFYAGARALLVSHWPVNSYAATMLTSRTFAEMRKDQRLGRADAFRRAMLALMDDPTRPWAAHPSVWAPFIVGGEGGAAR